MTTTVAPGPGAVPTERRHHGVEALWRRELEGYPTTRARLGYLSVLVGATIVLYYEAYAPGGVSPLILAHYRMSFTYYLNLLVVGAVFGAFATWLGGFSDKVGRANMIIWGQLVVALLTLFAVPRAPSTTWYAAMVIVVGMVEGVILVASPALVRDFSPQMGRASAMGFWTLGPVAGSLIVSIVANHTLSHLHAWQDQFIIAGTVGLVMFVISLLFLRELSPAIRDQRMVTVRDRIVVEARARGLDVSSMLSHPVRQMLKWELIASGFGVSVFLLIYYAAVGFFTIYFVTTYGMSTAQANGINTWGWAFNCVALVVAGVLSDRVRVRKPFMVLGAVGTVAMTMVFIWEANNAHLSYYSIVVMVSLLFAFLGIAYAPWMAHYTEAVERRNPALTATGLAVWGWILRIVVALATLAVPHVVTSVTPLVSYGGQVQAVVARYPALSYVDSQTLNALAVASPPPAAVVKAITEITGGQHVSQARAVNELLALRNLTPADKAILSHAPAVVAAAKNGPTQWQRWWWVCLGGQVVFLVVIFTAIRGRWSPRRARQDIEEYEAKLRQEEEAVALRTAA
ncbi:MAG TPA: MFS transporter [Acidimicrobiales bacterium]|nr:MFS transporter [Acidimicrobiales bacterium]